MTINQYKYSRSAVKDILSAMIDAFYSYHSSAQEIPENKIRDYLHAAVHGMDNNKVRGSKEKEDYQALQNLVLELWDERTKNDQ